VGDDVAGDPPAGLDAEQKTLAASERNEAARIAWQVEATALAERLERAIGELGLPDTDLVGPAPAFLERLRGRYRWQVLVRGPDPCPLLREALAEGLAREWSVDVDPASTL
jgi:primosomal protein N'